MHPLSHLPWPVCCQPAQVEVVTWRFHGMSDPVAHSSLPKEPSSARNEEIMGGVIYSKNQVNINSSESSVQERHGRLWTWAAVEYT